MSAPRRSKRICERIAPTEETSEKTEREIKMEINDHEEYEEQVEVCYKKKSNEENEDQVQVNNKKKSSPTIQKPSTSHYLDSTKQPLWDTKKVVSATRQSVTLDVSSKYSLRSTRRKTYIENDNRLKLRKQDPLNSSISNKRRKKSSKLAIPPESKKIHYGWLLRGMDNLPISVFGDKDYDLEDPSDNICINERKNWAGKQVMCMGQKKLCKWM